MSDLAATATAAARFTVEQRSRDIFAVLGPNPNAGKDGVSYSGDRLTICTTDGPDDAHMIAAALNAYAPTADRMTVDELMAAEVAA